MAPWQAHVQARTQTETRTQVITLVLLAGSHGSGLMG